MIRQSQRGRRPSFTLVEILVVLAILVILTGLIGAALVKWMDSQRQANTKATIQKIQKHLDLQIKKVLEDASKEPIPASVVNLAGGDMPRARVIWKKLRLKQEFPNTLTEAKTPYLAVNGTNAGLNATDLPPITSYATAANKIVTGPGDSAALLVLILARNRGAGVITADDLGSAAVDVNNDGFKEVVDGWINPLQFYRWPTGQLSSPPFPPTTVVDPISQAVDALRPTNSTPFRDTLDPTGTLLNSAWYNLTTAPNNQRTQFEMLCHVIKPISAANGGTNGMYMIPVIVSAGPDGILGLDTTSIAVTSSGNTNDNIYSYTLTQ